MVANGVIGVTAQILASSDLPGGSEKPDDKSSMSIFQRMARGFKGMKQNFGQLVKNKGTGLMWMLLASSKVAQEFSLQVFKLLLFFVDILLAKLLPVINWLLNNLAELIDTVQNVIENLEKWFKEVFEPLWTWVRDHALAMWEGVVSLLGWDKEVDGTKETEEFLKEKVIGEKVTGDEFKTWASDPNDGLIEGGPISPSVWNAEDPTTPAWEGDPGTGGHTNSEYGGYTGETDTEADAPEQMSWVYKGGASTPPGGQIDSALVEPLIDSGKIKLIDAQLDEEDKQKFHDSFFTWLPTEDGEKFGWDDIQSWIGQTAEKYNFTGEDILRYFFGTYEQDEAKGEEVMDGVIGQMVTGPAVTVEDTKGYMPTHRPQGGVQTPVGWEYGG